MLQEIMRVDVDDRAKPESTFTIKKKKHNTTYGFSHFSTQYWLSVSLYNKELKKKKLCNLYLLSKLGT